MSGKSSNAGLIEFENARIKTWSCGFRSCYLADIPGQTDAALAPTLHKEGMCDSVGLIGIDIVVDSSSYDRLPG